MSGQLRPVCEPVFTHHGKQYLAHCVPDDEDTSALIVCLYRLLGEERHPQYIGWGVFGKRRFVSGVKGGKKFAQTVWEAIRKEVAR